LGGTAPGSCFNDSKAIAAKAKHAAILRRDIATDGALFKHGSHARLGLEHTAKTNFVTLTKKTERESALFQVRCNFPFTGLTIGSHL
jgi:hypothetical protein